MTYLYTAYDLTLRLPFACPALPPAPPDATPDVVVEEGEVPYQLTVPVAQAASWQVDAGHFLLRGGRRAGRFLVQGGAHVRLQRSPQAEEPLLGIYFLDSVLAAVLQQRGLLVLHANSAVTPRGAVAISGASGAGKSTTLAALLQRGCAMLADDITALRLAPAGASGPAERVEVLPGVPQLHLPEDAAAGLEQDIDGLPRFAWRRVKATVPAQAVMAGAPAPLRALYLLEFGDGQALDVQPLYGADRFAALHKCIYGPLLPEQHPGLFPLLTAVIAQASVYRLRRPPGRWTVDELAEVILNG